MPASPGRSNSALVSDTSRCNFRSLSVARFTRRVSRGVKVIRRRDFLEVGGLAALGGLAGGTSRAGPASGSPPRSLLVHSLCPENLATPIEWFDRLVVPTDVFFVRSHFGAPPIVPDAP